MISVLSKIAGQGLLALSSFVVSFAAAHSLNASGLAVFFVAWTLESMWIAAVRRIIVPALITSEYRPTVRVMWFVHIIASLPMGAAVYGVAYIGGLDVRSCLLLGFTPLTLGCYDVARTYLSLYAQKILPLMDMLLFVSMIILSAFVFYVYSISILDAALVAIVVSSLFVSSVVSFSSLCRISSPGLSSLRSWVRLGRDQIGTGFFEWVVFFAISMLGVFIFGFVGGAEVLAGVRLAETLVAPLSIAVSAIPLLLAPDVSKIRGNHLSSLSMSRRITGILFVGALMWVVMLLIVPNEWLGLVVGEHSSLAKAALLGIALGVSVSPLSTMLTFVMRVRGALREIRVVRLTQLLLTVPFVAVASLSGDPLIAALGLSAHQVVACLMLVVYERMHRKSYAGV